MVMTQDEAFSLVQRHLHPDSVLRVLPSREVFGHMLSPGEKPRARGYETYLVEVSEDGSREVVDRNGFN
jgi:hypothetical protein